MALNRYEYTKSEQGKYKSPQYPTELFQQQRSDYYIFSREGDRLDNIANEFYDDPRYWWVIAEANFLGKGTFAIEPGIQLRIPFPIENLLEQLENAEENK